MSNYPLCCNILNYKCVSLWVRVKTLWDKEKLLVFSSFSFSNNVFNFVIILLSNYSYLVLILRCFKMEIIHKISNQVKKKTTSLSIIHLNESLRQDQYLREILSYCVQYNLTFFYKERICNRSIWLKPAALLSGNVDGLSKYYEQSL